MTKTQIDELREWDRDYFGDLNTPGHRSFIEILSRHEAEQGEGLREIEEKMDSLAHYLSNNSDGGQYSKGMITAYWAARDIIREYRENHPTPTKPTADKRPVEELRRVLDEYNHDKSSGIPWVVIHNILTNYTPAEKEEHLAAKLAFDKEFLYEVSSSGGFYWQIKVRPRKASQGAGAGE